MIKATFVPTKLQILNKSNSYNTLSSSDARMHTSSTNGNARCGITFPNLPTRLGSALRRVLAVAFILMLEICATQVYGQTAVTANNPFSDDFESDNGWTLVNGNQTNKWTRGTAAANGGSNGLYITNGSTNTTYGYNNYANSNNNMVFAHKAFTFAAGNYIISYDWR